MIAQQKIKIKNYLQTFVCCHTVKMFYTRYMNLGPFYYIINILTYRTLQLTYI